MASMYQHALAKHGTKNALGVIANDIGSTDLISTGAWVEASRTISRMHGGGVIGRRSCALPLS